MSNTLTLPCEVGEVSDGYHTFNELYRHRHSLFLALMKTSPARSWISELHYDGGKYDAWFVAGMDLPTGQVTYHLPITFWLMATRTGAEVRERAPQWDGHTAVDVENRIQDWITGNHP